MVKLGREHVFVKQKFGKAEKCYLHLHPIIKQMAGTKCSAIVLWVSKIAGVAELVDALDLGSSAFGRGGSSPFTRTIFRGAASKDAAFFLEGG